MMHFSDDNWNSEPRYDEGDALRDDEFAARVQSFERAFIARIMPRIRDAIRSKANRALRCPTGIDANQWVDHATVKVMEHCLFLFQGACVFNAQLRRKPVSKRDSYSLIEALKLMEEPMLAARFDNWIVQKIMAVLAEEERT